MRSGRIFWGVTFLLGAVFLLLSKLGYLPGINVVGILLTIFFSSIIVKSIFQLNFAGILFPLAFIAIIYAEPLGITAITPWAVLLAALLGSIGLSLIFRKHPTYTYKQKPWDYTEVEHITDENSFKQHTTFGSSIKYVNTEQFVSGEINCSFSGVKVFFDHAQMQNNQATLYINASFSGVELYVPRIWKIEDKMHITAGGIDEKNKSNIETTHTLKLIGNMSFSGVEIIYV